MNSSLFKRMCVPIIAALLIIAGPVRAQDAKNTEEDDTAAQAKSEQTKASSDLRDSVHENLESIQDDVKSVDEIRDKQKVDQLSEERQEQAFGTDDEIDSVFDNAVQNTGETADSSQSTEKRSLLSRIKQLPIYLQSVPERVPFIRDRGLIFFGRIEIDYAHYSSGILASDSGFRIRSLRAGLAKAFKHNISAKAEIDLTDGDSNFADLYARYRHKKFGLFTVGNQRVAQTLVNQTSRISRTFMEEPLPAEAFGLGRRLAVGWDLNKKKGGIHTTLFGPDLNGSIGDSGYAARIYLNPSRSRLNVFHVGASYVYENMSRKTRFFSHPESRVTDERLVDTGIYEDISEQQIGALEIAGAWESSMFRSEFFRAKWNRTSVKDPLFKGFYVQVSKVLTGEHFNYTQGKFIRIRPENPRGAWEAAVRFSRVDLNDNGVTGGEEKNLSIGVNWYAPDNQFRVMSNLIFVRTDKYAGDESPTIFQLRAQFHW